MKKHILTVIAAAMLCGLASCGDKVTSESAGQKTTQPTTEAAAATEAAPEAEVTTAAEEATAPATTTNAAVQPASAPEGADLSVFHNNGSGAVVFDAPAGDQSEATLIAAAQLLYDSAHQTALRFSIGCPYSIDQNNCIEGSYGWQYYLVTQEGINSVADVKADYHKVFSDKYPDDINLTYWDGDGGVYCLCGQRGTNIEYVKSEVVSYDGKTDDELFFTVCDYYDASAWGDGPYTENRTFSAVIDPDGTWRAGTFTLPN